MFSAQELTQTKCIELHARRMLAGISVGGSPTKSSGFGFDFDRLRDYVPGDDVRFVDWRASARTQTLLTRSYRQERNRTILICLDASSSSFTGSGAYTKNKLMAHITGLCAYIAAYGKDSFGLCVIRGEKTYVAVPLGHGVAHAKKITDYACSLFSPDRDQESSWDQAVMCMRAYRKKPAMCMMISDCLSHDFKSLSHLLGVFDTLVFRIRDEFDVNPEKLAGWSVASNKYSYVSKNQARMMQEYAQRHWREQDSFFIRHGIDLCDIVSQKYTFALLQRFFIRRFLNRGV